MITTKKELYEYINADNSWFSPKSVMDKLIARFTRYPAYELKRYLIYLRKQEYYVNTARNNKFKGAIGLFYERKKNKLGAKLGIEIGPNCFEKGVQIYHGNIIVNPMVRVGEYCKLHGNNCIGNNGIVDLSPILGDGVDVGFGAVIIGNINIPNNTVIGANALVNRSLEKTDSVIAGVPAKVIR